MSVLYITQNGVTDHIGRSQIAPYVLGLAASGHRIHVLSAEKPGRDELISRYEAMFSAAGIGWTRIAYRNRPPVLGQSLTQTEMGRVARRIVEQEAIRLVHCRSFPAALIGYQLKRRTGVPFIFDFRDFSADGGLEKTTGLRRIVYWYFKRMEGPMVTSADKVVCLTHRAVHVLTHWYLAREPDAVRRFKVIPCCADFGHFDPARVNPYAREAARNRAGLKKDNFVLLYVGSLGPDYLLDEMVAFFRHVRSLRSSARFLFVCNNGRELVEAACRRQGVNTADICFVAADRDDVPALIVLADLSIMFYRQGLRSIGCSPTKLAELFACNVPVIANAGVGDLEHILSLERNGSVIAASLDDEGLRSVAEHALSAAKPSGNTIRQASLEFDVGEGVRRYAAVYDELLNQRCEAMKRC